MNNLEIMKKIGQEIKKRRLEKNISIIEFAKFCNMSIKRAKRVEEGLAVLKISDLDKFAKFFKISLLEFLQLVDF